MMDVILLEKVRNLGGLGDKVSVKAGYGRNFLIPQHKAVFATKKNIELFEQKRAELEEKARKAYAAAQQQAAKLNDIRVIISAQASDEGKLYGSVGVVDIQSALAKKSIEVSRREIVMPEGPFYAVGQYIVEIHLHSDVIANLQVEIESTK